MENAPTGKLSVGGKDHIFQNGKHGNRMTLIFTWEEAQKGMQRLGDVLALVLKGMAQDEDDIGASEIAWINSQLENVIRIIQANN